ncbi:MAG TPA: hypothetical protein VEH47_08965 [Candidatus Acidoferrales bacterium]|nr:hypothetical protein [Candidatus Acidoferrales bacterium]
MAEAVREKFDSKYGPSVNASRPLWPGKWERRWQSKDMEIVSGYDPDGVFVDASLPLASEWKQHDQRYALDHALEFARFQHAVAAAGVDPAFSQRMESLYQADAALADRLDGRVFFFRQRACDESDFFLLCFPSHRQRGLPNGCRTSETTHSSQKLLDDFVLWAIGASQELLVSFDQSAQGIVGGHPAEQVGKATRFARRAHGKPSPFKEGASVE